MFYISPCSYLIGFIVIFEMSVCMHVWVHVFVSVALCRHQQDSPCRKGSGVRVQHDFPQRHRQEVWDAQILHGAQDRAPHRGPGETGSDREAAFHTQAHFTPQKTWNKSILTSILDLCLDFKSHFYSFAWKDKRNCQFGLASFTNFKIC